MTTQMQLEDLYNKLFVNDKFYKKKLLAYSKIKIKKLEFIDIYIQAHDDVFLIYTGKNIETNEHTLEIFKAQDLYDIRLFNYIHSVEDNKIIKIPYYIPKTMQILDENVIEPTHIATQFFSITKNNFTFYANGHSFLKKDSYCLIDKYFSNEKDYNFVRKRIKENDEYTMRSACKNL